ncbi:Alpha/Beta hydrolase protein [Halteromyces radiatus]|uniref:Alpha/Beta hydrolase protein n=1 Tax=Halteromyces radiatus TaxID=101107 RepID=UPI00222055AE|nr:Alpha/Beta hydrolase protein [Halteromyces radiatus]KAI8098630.1 Alpha/Beta hydrolase protein [Halteromyces radiatus]
MTRLHRSKGYGRHHFEEIKALGKEALRSLHPTDQDESYFQPRRSTIRRWTKDKNSKLRPVRTFSQPYSQYAMTMAKNLILTLYFNWTMIFSAPLSALATVIVYPTFMVALLFVELFLKLFLEGMGGHQLILYLSSRYGKGLSIINWGDPSLLMSDESRNRVRMALPVLGIDTSKIEHMDHVFDISIAQTMTILSALVYERNDDLVKQAYDVMTDYPDDIDASDGIETMTERTVRHLLWESEKRIREFAKPMGLQFEGISELKSLGGPFCGLFWAEDYPCFIVCFKGTTPTNYEEFLVDCSIQRADARPYLFGAAHQGFYDSVFPTTDFGDDDKRDPYQAILDALHEKAKLLYPGKKAQVWVTGHSLGAAMSCLLFSRWLKCPEDLQESLHLRDCYVIGTPAVGDDDFASLFASHSNTPVKRRSTLWRVVNKLDAVCRLPVGYDNRIFGRFVSKWDFFNYAHVGHGVLIPHNPERPLTLKPSSYQSPGSMQIIAINSTLYRPYALTPTPPSDINGLPKWMQVIHSWHTFYRSWIPASSDEYPTKTIRNPLQLLECFYPPVLRDHIPHNYYHGLECARKFYT